MCVDENKTYHYIAEVIQSTLFQNAENKQIVTTSGDKMMISTSDTTIMVIDIGMFSQLLLDELWIEFGTGKHLRYTDIPACCKSR